jgi:hypothetical protein
MRTIGKIIIAVVIVTGIWIITTILHALINVPYASIQDKIAFLENPGFLYYLTYINASLITILTIAMFSGFYVYCRDTKPIWSIIAFSFIPIYGFGNLVAYLSQIFVVPKLVEIHDIKKYEIISEFILAQIIQDWPKSAIGDLNGISYGLLAIPTIIFSLIFIRLNDKLRTGSVLLIISGILSISGVIGLAINNDILRFMLILSGVIYFIALIYICIPFFKQQEFKEKK